MKKFLIVILISMRVLIACSTDSNSSNTNENSTPAAVPAEYAGLTNPFGPGASEAGAAVFKTNCATCHGPEGYGDGPAGQALEPRPKNLAELQPKVGDDFLFWRIREGKPGTSMVAWKGILTDEQIWQTISFIRSLR